jgi:prepilin-type processing-associated H-X9-DG protein
MSDEELIGYLCDALDPREHAAAESHLRTNPAAAARLDQLRLAFAPLEADREQPLPLAGLADRTVARVLAAVPPEPPVPAGEPLAFPALPRAPREEPEARMVGGRFRPDLIVACGIALFAGGLLFSAIGKVRARNELLACQANLQTLHTGLAGYADTHNGRYPQIGTNTPAGSFAAALAEAGQVPVGFRPACPADRSVPSAGVVPASAPAVTYTYTLGYRTPGGALVGLNRSAGGEEHDLIPICADFPTADAAPTAGPLCPHTLGMNVLYAGGNVRLTTSPLVGPGGDDIYRNVFGRVAAGAGRMDPVLGRPGDMP